MSIFATFSSFYPQTPWIASHMANWGFLPYISIILGGQMLPNELLRSKWLLGVQKLHFTRKISNTRA